MTILDLEKTLQLKTKFENYKMDCIPKSMKFLKVYITPNNKVNILGIFQIRYITSFAYF